MGDYVNFQGNYLKCCPSDPKITILICASNGNGVYISSI
jgi:hypothetical protein